MSLTPKDIVQVYIEWISLVECHTLFHHRPYFIRRLPVIDHLLEFECDVHDGLLFVCHYYIYYEIGTSSTKCPLVALTVTSLREKVVNKHTSTIDITTSTKGIWRLTNQDLHLRGPRRDVISISAIFNNHFNEFCSVL